MMIREAKIKDIEQIQVVRNAVKENTLSDPSLLTDKDCEEFLPVRGKGWVCQIDNKIVGFAIADLKYNNIWALFLHPEYENKGIGRKLHNTILCWYFSQTKTNAWLGTSPNTRAEIFYKKSGWTAIGNHGDEEIKFEMIFDNWTAIKANQSQNFL